MKTNLLAIALFTSCIALLGGCFDRDNDHPAKDADPSKPSLQMQQPETPTISTSPETRPQNQ